MGYRFMRVFVMYDLPSISTSDKRCYRAFRKFLLKDGFMMLQESVYCKLALNTTAANAIIESVRKNKPEKGFALMFAITENQFSRMEIVTGEYTSAVLDTNERLVIL